ncbi:DUF2809 domain-containing protein [Rasiella rasia]|uniref:DUF2809 domain-containing protein n=1 Tax=Rasiella rasia TaxID=2744027 RepID=A0A6G6GKT6_9FLAO|nr:DUF2809 domain-containing protein [Rasiella rasia]QIE59100.1 DUF2809 domain-containing protein [Rasiella rasia]
MKRTLTFFILLLVTEVAIAIFHFHKFIRGFVGDVLVIPLLYYFLRIFIKWRTVYLLGAVLAIALGIELLQYSGLFQHLNIQSPLLKIVLGTTFDWKDILAYGVGGVLTLLLEKNQAYGKD